MTKKPMSETGPTLAVEGLEQRIARLEADSARRRRIVQIALILVLSLCTGAATAGVYLAQSIGTALMLGVGSALSMFATGLSLTQASARRSPTTK